MPGDRRAVDRRAEVGNQRAGHARIEHDRHPAAGDLARIDPLDRPLAGIAADGGGGVEIGRVQRRRIIVIALHRRALAGDRRHRQRMVRAQIRAGKAAAGHQHHAADAGAGRSARRLGHALDRHRRRLGLERERFQARDAGQLRIREIEIGNRLREQLAIGQARERVLRRRACHRHRAFGQIGDAVLGKVVGGDDRLATADQHP